MPLPPPPPFPPSAGDDELAEPPAVAAAAAARPECHVVREQAVRISLRGAGEGMRDASRSWWLQCPGEPRQLLAQASRSAPVGADEAAAGGFGGVFGGGGGSNGGVVGGASARLDLDDLLRDFLRNGRRVPPPLAPGERAVGAGSMTAAERLGRSGGTPV